MKAGEQRVQPGQVMDCDYCHRPMTFEEYCSHHCDGLSGRNPWDERLKKAKWRSPDGKPLKGSVSAIGTSMTEMERIEYALSQAARRRVKVIGRVVLALVVAILAYFLLR